ncbi:MAG: hypothetical protein ABMA64_35520 [Myxococcota bacterium]
MSTLCGALVERGERDLTSLASKHRITVLGPLGPWVFVRGDVNMAHIEPPRFASALSSELEGSVIAFMLQTTASSEVLEHWERGALVRRLVCQDGRWKTREGMHQAWESIYFFDPSEGIGEGEKWPLTLDDDLTEQDEQRYEEAKRAGDPSAVLDLLRGGSVWPLHRLAKHLGVDLRSPAASYSVPANWKPWLALTLALAFVCSCGVLGALSR